MPTPQATGTARRPRIAVLYESGRNGIAALSQAAALAGGRSAELTVVALAPQASAQRGCGPSPEAYNCAVRDQVTQELSEAMRRINLQAGVALLVEGNDLPFETWLAQREVELVLLPARRSLGLRSGSHHPAARRVRRLTGAEVRVVPA